MSDLKSLLKTTPRYLSILDKNWIRSIKDFLQYFPRTYEDRSQLKTLNKIASWSVFFQDTNNKNIFMTKWIIVEKKMYIRWKYKVFDIIFNDIEWSVWYISIFNSYFAAKKIIPWKRYIIIWKPKVEYVTKGNPVKGKIIFSHPEVIETQAPETENNEDWYNLWRLFPIYPELNWITSWRFAKKMRNILSTIEEHFDEHLPKEFLEEFKIMGAMQTIKEMHYPTDLELQKKALDRIFFDRLLRIQLVWMINKKKYLEGSDLKNFDLLNSPNRELIKSFIEKLPFELTNAQKKVLKVMIENFHDEKPMIRLLQWDVWSWKTIVAIIGAYYIHKIFWWKSVFLAPLEVLAQQHYKNIAKILLPLGLKIELLTWSTVKSQKEKIKSDLKFWKIDILVWTHAILQEDVEFKDLRFAIIDEQHKFGVKQRAFLKNFWGPHILQMSATPIPRSLALAFFWEFDVSIIDEMPVWRKPIQTKIIAEKELIKIKPWIMTKISQWQKVFIVTPLIEESEKLDEVKSATVEFEETRNLYPELKWKIGLLHGKLKPKEKQQIMEDFKSWKLSILVSTTVIEVWIDIPEATIMMIKNAERFGLSQLHQLRGRIWRSDLQSYCFLETKSKWSIAYKRLKAMEETNDWFQLAQLDLQNRWAGEVLWTRQSWETDIPYEILSDITFIKRVQEWARQLMEKYPDLSWLDVLKKYLEEKVENVIA